MVIRKEVNVRMYISSYEEEAQQRLADKFSNLLRIKTEFQPLIFLCIGSDRSIGDCLGPLVGHFLHRNHIEGVYGCLEEPIHAVNLPSVLDTIYRQHPSPFIVAIDACVGRHENVGYIQIEDLPLRPGEGVGKELPEIGQVSIKAIINGSTPGIDQYHNLATTRLHTVYHMAQCISNGISKSLK